MRLILTADHIRLVAPSNPDPDAVVAALIPVLQRHGIDARPERLGMFLAQWAHESNFVGQSENLSYAAERLCQVWPSRFPTLAAARPYARNPRALANQVYNGRMGNSPGSDDGWTYRGRGWPQLTGRDAYRTYGRLLALDLENDPDLLLHPEVSAAVCGFFWANRGLNRLADQGDLISVTQGINGGQNGLDDRLARYRRVIGPLRDLAAALESQEQLVRPTPAPAPEVLPWRRLFVNGVEVDPREAILALDVLSLPGGTYTVTKQSRVGDKLYVQTA